MDLGKKENIVKLRELSAQNGIVVSEGSKVMVNAGLYNKTIDFGRGLGEGQKPTVRATFLESVLEDIPEEKVEEFFYETILPSFETEAVAKLEDLSENEIAKSIIDMVKHGDIMPCALNTEANRDILNTAVSRETMDLSIVYRLILKETEDGIRSVLITESILEASGLTEKELFQKGKDYVLAHMKVDSFSEIFREAGVELEMKEDRMFVIRYSHGINGSGILAMAAEDEEILASLREDCPIYILPSSIDEIILLKDRDGSVSVSEYAASVENVNIREVESTGWLSNSVYVLNPETGKAELAHRGKPLSYCMEMKNLKERKGGSTLL